MIGIFWGAVRTASRILIMWDRRVVTRLDSEIGAFSVSCPFKPVENDKTWVFLGVYGPCVDAI